MMTYFNLVEGPQAVVPGRDHVWQHAVQETDEPAESQTTEMLNEMRTIKALHLIYRTLESQVDYK